MILQNLSHVKMRSKIIQPKKNIGKKYYRFVTGSYVIKYYVICLDFVMFVIYVSLFNF